MAKLELSEQRLHSVKKAEEYYNALRTNIQLSGDGLKVIALSSVRPGEGKSTTSTNIAWLSRVQVIRHSLSMPIFVIQLCQVSSNLEKKLPV